MPTALRAGAGKPPAPHEAEAVSAEDADLLAACAAGDLEGARAFIARGADVNAAAPSSEARHGRRTPLLRACEGGHAELVAELLIARADIERACDETTALMEACRVGAEPCVRALLRARADVDGAPGFGRTALMWASLAGETSCARVLLDAGARADKATELGSTALMSAAMLGHSATCAVLLGARADPNRSMQGGRTALWCACEENRAETAMLLVRHGSSVNAPVLHGRSALMWACSRGLLELATLLLRHSADVNAVTTTGECTALIAACQAGRAPIVRALLDAGAGVGFATYSGNTALHACCAQPRAAGRLECAAALLGAAADVNQQTRKGLTPLEASLAAGPSVPMAQLLCAHGARRGFPTGRSAEQMALDASLRGRHSSADAAHAALAADWLGRTREWVAPLHFVEVLPCARVRELLRGGADLHARAPTPGAPSPLELAQRVLDSPGAPGTPAALLVRAAAGPWSARTHELFPPAQRERAVELLLLGHQLSETEVFATSGQQQAIRDVWLAAVMPHAVGPRAADSASSSSSTSLEAASHR